MSTQSLAEIVSAVKSAPKPASFAAARADARAAYADWREHDEVCQQPACPRCLALFEKQAAAERLMQLMRPAPVEVSHV